MDIIWALSLIFLSVFAICCLSLWIYSSPFYWKKKGVPYLFPWPIFGNNFTVFTTSLAKFYDQLYNKYPNERFYGYHFFTRPTIILKDPKLVKDVFITDFEYFTSNGLYTNEDSDPIGSGLLFLHGQAWKDVRTRLSKHFTPSKLRSIYDYVENSSSKAYKFIDKSLANNETIQIEKMMVNITTDIIMRALLGIETDCFEEISNFGDMGKRMFSAKSTAKIIISFIEPKINDLLKLNIFEKNITDLLEKVLQDVIKYREENKIDKSDFVQGMMDMMKLKREHPGEKYFPDKTRIPDYNFRNVLSHAMLLISGGTESTAGAMSFFLYEAALQQDIQEKCRAEVMCVVNETGMDIRTEDVSKLPYLDMAVKETLRKYPSFIAISRKCTKAYKISDSDVIVEPGTLVIAPIRSLHWDPKHFPNPEQFIPERFAEDNKGSKESSIYMPWGLGPRSCIGQNLAKLEIFLILSRLLRRYRFTISPKTQVPIKCSPYTWIISPESGIWLDLHPVDGINR